MTKEALDKDPIGGSDIPNRARKTEKMIEPACESYGHWVDPSYPIVAMGSSRKGKRHGQPIPKGVEVIACFEGPGYDETVTLYLSRASLKNGAMEKLVKGGFFPHPEQIGYLEQVLRLHGQRQVYHANPADGVRNAADKDSYAVMHMYNAAEYIVKLLRIDRSTDPWRMQELERRIEESLDVRPFRLTGGVLYLTALQANIVQREILGETENDAMHDTVLGIRPHRWMRRPRKPQ